MWLDHVSTHSVPNAIVFFRVSLCVSPRKKKQKIFDSSSNNFSPGIWKMELERNDTMYDSMQWCQSVWRALGSYRAVVEDTPARVALFGSFGPLIVSGGLDSDLHIIFCGSEWLQSCLTYLFQLKKNQTPTKIYQHRPGRKSRDRSGTSGKVGNWSG